MNLTEEEQLELVKKHGFAILDIKNPSEEVKLEAVKNSGNVIFYIKNPSKEIQLEAIKQFPYILNNPKCWIKNPCQEILDMAMIKDIIE